jgi:PAS domain S-box-containing protein
MGQKADFLRNLFGSNSSSAQFDKELAERKKSELKFKGLLESAPDAMVITNGEGKILMVNAQAERIFGFERNEIIGKEIEILIPERYQKKHIHHRHQYVENSKVRAMGAGMALYGMRKDGTEFPVEVSLSPLKLEDGEFMVMSAIRDISRQKEIENEIKKINENLELLVKERTKDLEEALQKEKETRIENTKLYQELQEINQELEQRVIRRTLELEAINKELEAFSYSVSHDLRAPLRSIDGFSNKILKDYSALFDKQARDYFDRIMNASRKMGFLIDDLLKLARLSRVEMKLEHTNMSEMAEAILLELKETNPERQSEFIVEPGMLEFADRNLLQVALENLLGNAWKYSKNQPVTKIEFGSVQRERKTYFIRDNGVGFDMRYVDKLFGAFQRLHNVADFEGTGIGLATVLRIIRRHHGNISAESEINKGTTFYFTLNE